MKLQAFLTRLFNDEEGQDMIEYALLATLISLIAFAAITTIGTRVNTLYEDIRDDVTTAGS
jgi:pilus assembly protein Flp/PilA